MARVEHDAFLAQVNARSDLSLKIRVKGAEDDGILPMGGSAGTAYIGIGLLNEGSLAATRTTLNVLVPFPMPFRWCQENGEEIGEPQPYDPARLEGGETLPDPERGAIEAWYRDRTVDRVGLSDRMHLWVALQIGHLPSPGELVNVPIRVKVSADEQPEGRREIIEDHLVQVRATG